MSRQDINRDIRNKQAFMRVTAKEYLRSIGQLDKSIGTKQRELLGE